MKNIVNNGEAVSLFESVNRDRTKIASQQQRQGRQARPRLGLDMKELQPSDVSNNL